MLFIELILSSGRIVNQLGAPGPDPDLPPRLCPGTHWPPLGRSEAADAGYK